MRNYIKIFFLLLLFFATDVKAQPANESFVDDNLYHCIIDAYNKENTETKDYSYNILPEELIEMKSLDCSSYSGSIESLIGLNKMTGLTSLNLSGNTFLGGSLKIDKGKTGTLKSNLVIPSQLSLSNKKYVVSKSNILSVTNGNVTGLSEGSAYVTMTATISGNEIKERYLVAVSSVEAKSDNATLSSLSLSLGDINFKSNIDEYTVIVPNSASSITISAKLADSGASFVSGYGPRKVSLKVGTNTVYIKVKAENGTLNVYTLGITRSDGNDSNNLLANIELSSGFLDFDSDVDIYSLTVEYDVDKLEVTPVTESLLSKATVSDTNLKVGENKITIVVTAENGNTKNYELLVTREQYESEKNYLKDLVIKDYNIDFSKTNYSYTITIKKEDSLDITATVDNPSSSVSIIGNKYLKNNSKITIRVTDEDKIARDYYLTVKRLFIYDFSYKEWLLVIEFSVITILILFLIFRPKQRKKRMVKRQYIMNETIKNKVCKKCGAINDPMSRTCYVCGRELN